MAVLQFLFLCQRRLESRFVRLVGRFDHLVHDDHVPFDDVFTLGFLLQLLVVGVDVAHTLVAQEPIAPFHLLHRPLESQGGFLGIGHHRQEQVRNTFVDGEFQHFRVDHDDPHVLGRRGVEEGKDHGVDGNRFPRAGRACHQQVGHAGQVGHHRRAGDVLAQGHGKLHLAAMELFRGEYLPEGNHFPLAVRYLDPHDSLAGDGGNDADRKRLERHGEVIGKAGDAVDLDAGAGRVFEHGDDRAGAYLHHFAIHIEIQQFFLQQPGVHGEEFPVNLTPGLGGGIQERQGRGAIGAFRPGEFKCFLHRRGFCVVFFLFRPGNGQRRGRGDRCRPDLGRRPCHSRHVPVAELPVEGLLLPVIGPPAPERGKTPSGEQDEGKA